MQLTASPESKFPSMPVMPDDSRLFPFFNSAFFAPSSNIRLPADLVENASQCFLLVSLSSIGKKSVPISSPENIFFNIFLSRPFATMVGTPKCAAFFAASSFVCIPPVP